MSLEETREQLFGDRKLLLLAYSEPADRPRLNLREQVTESLNDIGLNLAGQMAACAGLFPIWIITYQRLIERPVPFHQTREYILGMNGEEIAYSYETAFVEQVAGRRIILDLVRDLGRGCLDEHAGYRVGYFYLMPGERFVELYFALEAIPDIRPSV